ncbi:MAG: division/cell wall cluster transcriptional repressor MraZ [Oscillospiraceae bacterium]|nr:division/cell wall cluster transcriptional repressor MraZ [Oscillospiraceae bacterium]
MFMGEYNYVIDDKGRLNFPPKFREQMGESFIVTRWLDDCLVAFPQTEWQRISDLLSEKSMVKARDVQRFLYASAMEAAADKQGRILLPQNLREHAGLAKDVTIIGVGSHAEIWSTESWRNMNERMRSGPIAAAMEEMEF